MRIGGNGNARDYFRKHNCIGLTGEKNIKARLPNRIKRYWQKWLMQLQWSEEKLWLVAIRQRMQIVWWKLWAFLTKRKWKLQRKRRRLPLWWCKAKSSAGFSESWCIEACRDKKAWERWNIFNKKNVGSRCLQQQMLSNSTSLKVLRIEESFKSLDRAFNEQIIPIRESKPFLRLKVAAILSESVLNCSTKEATITFWNVNESQLNLLEEGRHLRLRSVTSVWFRTWRLYCDEKDTKKFYY